MTILNDLGNFIRSVAYTGFNHALNTRESVPFELPETVEEAQAVRAIKRSSNLEAVANCINPEGKYNFYARRHQEKKEGEPS